MRGIVLVFSTLVAGGVANRLEASDPLPSPASVSMRLQLDVTPEHVDFMSAEGMLAGRYRYRDRFKPHFHPLASPKGHVVSLASPHDHQHHKGLMYALRTPEFNFWEERSTLPGEQVGRQRHVAFADVRRAGEETGFTEILVWEPADGGAAVFEETRRISCRRGPGAFIWTWETSLRVQRATKLVQSQWSHPQPDGRKVNYHGLGLRLRREFGGGTRNNALQLDDGPLQWNRGGKPVDFTRAMGVAPTRVTFVGTLDGIWPLERVAVAMAQEQRNGLFIMESPFAFMALGPSNLAERPLAAGETIVERYTITIADH